MPDTNLLTTIRAHAAANQLDDALGKLQRLLKGSPLLDEALQQSGRYAAIKEAMNRGAVNQEESTATINHIRSGILYLVSEADKLVEDRADIRQETEATTIRISQQAEKIYNINHIDRADFH